MLPLRPPPCRLRPTIGFPILHALLQELEAVTAAGHTLPPVFSQAVDHQLVQVRLGAAASLFAALRCKHPATAAHSLRVALNCSAWALHMNVPEAERDTIEVAALLHDVGVIGAPDQVLLKSTALEPDEMEVMNCSRKMGLDILRCGCASSQVLEIIECIPVWYDGRQPFDAVLSPACDSAVEPQQAPRRHAREIPLGARMIAIVEAFDAITTDHVYRPGAHTSVR